MHHVEGFRDYAVVGKLSLERRTVDDPGGRARAAPTAFAFRHLLYTEGSLVHGVATLASPAGTVRGRATDETPRTWTTLRSWAASFDLPITLGVLAGSGQLASERFDDYAVVGELSLEGRTRPAKAPAAEAAE
jgi:hypothetical protein